MSTPSDNARLTLASGGALETAMMPYYISRFLMAAPIELRVALSPSAESFVSTLTLEALCHQPVYTEASKLNPYTGEPLHLTYAKTDALFIYPATARILASIALGIIQCPVTRLAAHFDKSKIIIVPWLHPDHDPRIYQPHIASLKALGCQLVLPADGGLHWQTESGWMKGIDSVMTYLHVCQQNIHQMQWAAHHE